jgi:hypothetical protein
VFRDAPATILQRHVLVRPDDESVSFFPVGVRVGQNDTEITTHILADYTPTGLGARSADGLFPFLLGVSLVLADDERIECGKVMLSLNGQVPGVTTASRPTREERLHIKRAASEAVGNLGRDTAVDEELRAFLTQAANS